LGVLILFREEETTLTADIEAQSGQGSYRRSRRFEIFAVGYCFTSRAVHIENLRALETNAFLQALLGFISNHEWPKEFWSEYGTNFAGVGKEIRDCIG